MTEILSTTPYRRRTHSCAPKTGTDDRQRQGDGISRRPDAAGVFPDKWKLFRLISEIRRELGLSDRTLTVLRALLSCHREQMLTQGPIIVFPSNRELATRASGMADATLRRHLSSLIETGLLRRHDSPNGKRYARRSGTGMLLRAFGFDLAPLVERAGEFERIHRKLLIDRADSAARREEITLIRRDIRNLAQDAIDSANPGPWQRFLDALSEEPSQRLIRLDLNELTSQARKLAALRRELINALNSLSFDGKVSANAARNERHNKTRIPDSNLPDSSPAPSSPSGNAQTAISISRQPATIAAPQTQHRRSSHSNREMVFDEFMTLCPDIRDYIAAPLRGWSDLLRSANLIRACLGINGTLWADASRILGEGGATILTCALIQASERVANPAGYLRSLLKSAGNGRFKLFDTVRYLASPERAGTPDRNVDDRRRKTTANRLQPRLATAGEPRPNPASRPRRDDPCRANPVSWE